MHNVPALMRAKDRCTLLVHPDDADALGLSDARNATVETDGGSVDVVVQVSADMMPGVVSLPHGWGHGLPGTMLTVANAHPGVNANVPNPVEFLDVPSSTHVVNGVPCRVRPGRRDVTFAHCRPRGALRRSVRRRRRETEAAAPARARW